MQTGFFYETDNGRLFMRLENWLYACEVITGRYYPVDPVDLDSIEPWLVPCTEAEFMTRRAQRAPELAILSERAASICRRAHEGQKDRGGKPYAQHPIAVALMCNLEEERIVAYLHDVIEDTSFTLEQLIAEGMPEWVIDSVLRLSKDRSDPSYSYRNYLAEIKRDPIARAVKIADMVHNSDPTRPLEYGAFEISHYFKYKQSLAFLRAEQGAEYIPPEGVSPDEG